MHRIQSYDIVARTGSSSLQSDKYIQYRRMSQDNAQETLRALFADIEGSASARTLSAKLFQCMVIDYECLQKIRIAHCDTDSNAVLAEHLYRTSTEKTLKVFAHILKESGLPKQRVLGERIEASLTKVATANAIEAPSTVSSDERAQAPSRGP